MSHILLFSEKETNLGVTILLIMPLYMTPI